MRLTVLWLLAVIGAAAQYAGDWKGDSACAAAAPCRDEKVVWHVSVIEPGRLSVRGDRVEEGKTVAMGTLEFHADADGKAYVWDGPPGRWRVTFAGNRLEGTMTRRDGVIFRKLELRRVE